MVDLTQGYLLARIDGVMQMMWSACPRLKFPDDPGPDGNRLPILDPNNWQRGGTSPSGQDFGDMATSSWFVGDTYLKSTVGSPWRIVWLPALFGEERYVPGANTGVHPYADEAGGGDSAMALDAAGIGLGYRKILTRIVPVRIDLWGSDYPDMDMLIHWMASCVWATNAGAAESAGEKTIQGGGGVPNEAGQRGLRYQMMVNFAFPIIAPYMAPGGSADSVQGNSVVVTAGTGSGTELI